MNPPPVPQTPQKPRRTVDVLPNLLAAPDPSTDTENLDGAAEPLLYRKHEFAYNFPRKSRERLIKNVGGQIREAKLGSLSDNDCFFHARPPKVDIDGRYSGRIPVSPTWKCQRGEIKMNVNVGTAWLIVHGKLTSAELDGWINHSWQLSHLCGNWTCMNERHWRLESKAMNLARNACFRSQTTCHHTPRCMIEKKRYDLYGAWERSEVIREEAKQKAREKVLTKLEAEMKEEENQQSATKKSKFKDEDAASPKALKCVTQDPSRKDGFGSLDGSYEDDELSLGFHNLHLADDRPCTDDFIGLDGSCEDDADTNAKIKMDERKAFMSHFSQPPPPPVKKSRSKKFFKPSPAKKKAQGPPVPFSEMFPKPARTSKSEVPKVDLPRSAPFSTSKQFNGPPVRTQTVQTELQFSRRKKTSLMYDQVPKEELATRLDYFKDDEEIFKSRTPTPETDDETRRERWQKVVDEYLEDDHIIFADRDSDSEEE